MKYFITFTAALTLAAAAPLASAADLDREGVYGVVGIGKSDIFAPAKNGQGTRKQKLKDGRFAYTLGAGYRLNNNLALEADFSSQLGGRKSSKKNAGRAKDMMTGRALSVSALGILPLGESVELYGRAGIGYLQGKYSPAAGSDARRTRSTALAPVYGVGANFHVSKNSFLRTEWTTMKTRSGNKAAQAAGGNRLHNRQINVAYGYNF